MTPAAIRKRQSRMRQSEQQKVVERATEAARLRHLRAKQDELDPAAASLRRERNAVAHFIARAQQAELDPAAAALRRERDAVAHNIARAQQAELDPAAAARRRERDAEAHRLASLRARADRDEDPCALLELGLCHLYGRRGIVANSAEAVSLFLRASVGPNACHLYTPATEDARAEVYFRLGDCYARGEGVEANADTALLYFAKVRHRPTNPRPRRWAHYSAARVFALRCPVAALSEYKHAADYTNKTIFYAEGRFAFGVCVQLHFGVRAPTDPWRAWFRCVDHRESECPYLTAIPRGPEDFSDSPGEGSLSQYRSPSWSERDFYLENLGQAANCYLAAADMGHDAAMYFYGTCCERDTGVPKHGEARARRAVLRNARRADPAQAAIWFRRSAEAGYAAAMTKLAV